MEGLIPINKRTKQFAIRIAKLYSFSPFPQLFNLSPLLFTSDTVSLKPAAHRNMSAANPTTATPPLVSDPLSPFLLKAIFSDHRGPNVRNEVAHGLKTDVGFDGSLDMFVWWFA